MEEIINNYKTKRDTVLNSFTENFDKFYSQDHEDLDLFLDFVNTTDRTIKYLVSLDNLNFSADIQLQKISDSLSLVVKIYLIDKVWNEDKANTWLLRAITAVLSEDYSFDGVRFTKGNKSVLKTKI